MVDCRLCKRLWTSQHKPNIAKITVSVGSISWCIARAMNIFNPIRNCKKYKFDPESIELIGRIVKIISIGLGAKEITVEPAPNKCYNIIARIVKPINLKTHIRTIEVNMCADVVDSTVYINSDTHGAYIHLFVHILDESKIKAG